jgi:hypothetical protein
MAETIEIKSTPTGPEAPAKTTPASERPAYLPEKFKTPEDLAKAYTDLEKKLGTSPKVEDKTTIEQPKTETNPEQQAPANVADFEAEFAREGKLSDDSYAKLEKQGFSKQVVDNYIAGQHARVEASQNEIFSTVGGKETYGQMVEWAKASMSPAEIQSFNQAVSSNDMNVIKLAVGGLHSRFVAANGRDPKLIGGERTVSGPAPFESTQQLVEAMRDPKYAKDPAYRKTVQDRLARSSIM